MSADPKTWLALAAAAQRRSFLVGLACLLGLAV
jgi:hypothetical protein